MNYFEKSRNQWIEERWGKFTGSKIFRLLGTDMVFDTYVEEVAAEADSNVDYSEKPLSKAMKDGHIFEPVAFAFYQRIMQVNFGDMFDISYYGNGNPLFKSYDEDSGSSPDAIVYKKDGSPYILSEFKCPERKMQFFRIREVKTWEDLKEKHFAEYVQVQFNMMNFGVQLGHFCSFNEEFKTPSKQFILIEVPEDKELQLELKVKLSLAKKRKAELLTLSTR